MMFDYHNHTPRCNHATGNPTQYIEQALALGFSEFGFSEHSPWMMRQEGKRPMCLEWDEVPDYVAEVQALQARFNRPAGAAGAVAGAGLAAGDDRPFCVRLGMEMDFVPTRLDVAREMAAAYPWDVLLGSVHHLGLWGVPDPVVQGLFAIEDICDYYFELVRALIRAELVDVLTHLDLPKRFGTCPPGGMRRWIDPLIPEIRDAGLTVEVNMSGLDHAIAEPYPNWDVVARLAAAGVPLMISADAHAPREVGRHRAIAVEKLKAIGVTELASFEHRHRIMVPLA